MADINRMCEGEHYFDKEAAQDIFCSTGMSSCTPSPFVHVFLFGGTNGYWTGSHTIIQVEGSIDCLRVALSMQCETAFLFDHSSGHAKKRLNGLCVMNMTKGKAMRPIMIKQTDDYIGPYIIQATPV